MNEKDKPTELSYYGLYLLSHLKENHPKKAHDVAFIESHSDHVADEYEQARLEGYLPEGAHEFAMPTLLEGLHFSKYDGGGMSKLLFWHTPQFFASTRIF